MEQTIAWLLQGPPWVQYRTRIDLLNQPESDAEVIAARMAMLVHFQVQAAIAEASEWPESVLKSHKDAKHPIHKLSFLSEIGLKTDDPGMAPLIETILAHQSPAGPFQVRLTVATHFGGTGTPQWSWMLCDAPLVLYSLVKLGVDVEERVEPALQFLTSLIQDNGWRCTVADELGKFRGPGRRDDPCLYANLVMLKVLAQFDRWREHDACRIGAGTLLNLWDQRKERRPYLFAMGTDFAKLKAPLIWYDIIHVLDVLSQYPWLRDDPRLLQMLAIVEQKRDDQGRFTPESVWMAWKGWDFGQKKQPSPWLTFLVLRILKRLGRL